MDRLKQIQELLEKFYEGNTERDEEIALKHFFEEEDIPTSLAADKELFTSMSALDQSIEVPAGLKSKIIGTLDQIERSEKRVRRISIYSLTGLAAGLILLFSVYLGFLKEEKNGPVIAQYTIDDPEIAYQEARKALELIAEKWNTGTSELKNLQQVNKGIETVNTFNKISSGSRELNLLGNLRKAEEIKF